MSITRIVLAAAITVALLLPAAALAAEQKLVYLEGSYSSVMTGDDQAKVGEVAQSSLPALLSEGWRVVSMHVVQNRNRDRACGYAILEK